MQLNGWLARTLLLTLATTPLIGCGEEKPDASVPRGETIVVAHCGTNAQMTAADEKRASVELSQLPESSIIGNKIVPDWMRMRDENDSCAKDNSTPLRLLSRVP